MCNLDPGWIREISSGIVNLKYSLYSDVYEQRYLLYMFTDRIVDCYHIFAIITGVKPVYRERRKKL